MIIEYIKSLYNRVKKTEIKPSYIEGSMKNIMNLLYKMNLDFKKCEISLEKDCIELKYIDNIESINNTSSVPDIIGLNIIFEVTYADKMYDIYLRYDKNITNYSSSTGASIYGVYSGSIFRSNNENENQFEITCLDNSVDVKWKDVFNFFEKLNDLKQQYLFETFLLNMKTEYKLLRDEKLEILMKSIENKNENTDN